MKRSERILTFLAVLVTLLPISCAKKKGEEDITLSTFYTRGHEEVKIGMSWEEFKELYPGSELSNKNSVTGTYEEGIWGKATYVFDTNLVLRSLSIPQKEGNSGFRELMSLDAKLETINMSFPRPGIGRYGRIWDYQDHYITTGLTGRRIIVQFERKDNEGTYTDYLRDQVHPADEKIREITRVIAKGQQSDSLPEDPGRAINRCFERWSEGDKSAFFTFNENFYGYAYNLSFQGIHKMEKIVSQYTPSEFSFGESNDSYANDPNKKSYRLLAMIEVMDNAGNRKSIRQTLTVRRAGKKEVLMARHYGLNLEQGQWLFDLKLKDWE